MPIGRFCPKCGTMIRSDVILPGFREQCKCEKSRKKADKENSDKNKKKPTSLKIRLPYEKF